MTTPWEPYSKQELAGMVERLRGIVAELQAALAVVRQQLALSDAWAKDEKAKREQAEDARVQARSDLAVEQAKRAEVEVVRLREALTALDTVAGRMWQDIKDWTHTARGLRERSADADHDPSCPSQRGIDESERILAEAQSVFRQVDAALKEPKPERIPRCSICRRDDCHQNHACE